MSDLRHAPLLLTLVLFCGCRTDLTAERNAVDSMMKVLTKVEAVSRSVDTGLLRQYMKDVHEKCAKVQGEMSDTLDLETARQLIDFCDLNGHLRSCLDRKAAIDGELVRTRNHLSALLTDLREGAADRDSMKLFIEQEFMFVESLDERSSQVVAELNGCFKTYAELKGPMDRLLISLPDRGNTGSQ